MNRREVLQSGAAFSAASILPLNALASAGRGDVFSVIHDSRFRDSLGLSKALLDSLPAGATSQGLQTVSGNVAPLWYHHLSGAWTHGGALAGVTGDRVLFCLAQFARNNHMRVRWRKAHDRFILDTNTGKKEQLVSWLIG